MVTLQNISPAACYSEMMHFYLVLQRDQIFHIDLCLLFS